jgi:ribonucleoside-diphosphate reductase alpha chain
VAQALAQYLDASDSQHNAQPDESSESKGNGYKLLNETAQQGLQENFIHKVGDLCPECGQASVVNEEGCRKCYSCGYSEC